MSSFTIVGYFALTNDRKVDVPKKNSGRTTTFTEYTSYLQCSNDTATDLIIHHYSQTTPLPDLTVAFVVAKASIHANPVEDSYGCFHRCESHRVERRGKIHSLCAA